MPMDSEKIKEKLIIPAIEHRKKNCILGVVLKFVSFAFIMSDVFKDNVLYVFPGTVSGGDSTLSGLIVQCIFMMLLWTFIENYI